MCHTVVKGPGTARREPHIARTGDTEATRTARRDVGFAVADGVDAVDHAFQPAQVPFDVGPLDGERLELGGT